MKKIIAVLLSVMIVFAAFSALCVNAAAVSSPGNTVVVDSTVKGSGGKITPSANYKPGESPKYYITPDPGYKVKQVWIDGKPMGAITEFTFNDISENHTVEVEFEKDPNYKPTSSTTAPGTTVANTGKTSPDTGSEANTYIVVSAVVGATLIATFAGVAVSKKNRKEEN